MRWSASKSALLSICAYPYRDDVTAPEADSGTDAKIGTIAWARVAAFIEGKDDPGNGELVGDDARNCDEYYVAGVNWAKDRRRLGWRCEVMFAWSPSKDMARELPPSTKLRDYYHTPECHPLCARHCNGDEKPGSTDLVYFDSEGMLCVDDVKTGITPLVVYIPQIRTLGMMAARANGVRRVRVKLIKLYKDKPAEEWADELDGFAIDAIADERISQLAAVAKAKPVPGSHCTEMYCPARLACPEVPVAIAELMPAEALVKRPKWTHEFVSYDNDAALLEYLRLVEKACEDLYKLIKKRTPVVGAVLTDGRILREDFHDESRMRQDSLIAKLRELGTKAGLTDEDIDRTLEDCKYSFSKSQGLKVKKPPKELKAPKENAA